MIGGTGRSGTTLLRRIFDHHPKVATLSEFYITVAPGGLYDFYRTLNTQWTPYLFDDRIEALKRVLYRAENSYPLSKYYRYALRKTGFSDKGWKLESSFTGVGIKKHCPNYRGLVNELLQNLTDVTYDGTWTGKLIGSTNKISVGNPSPTSLKKHLSSFYRSLASSVANKKQATHFVEDNTWNILYFSEIRELLPEARLIHIYRDPRDVVASLMQQTWAPSDAVESAYIYKNLMDRWQEIKQHSSPDSFLEISLEDLVDENRITLEKICGFWGLAWDDRLLNLKLDKAHSGRWRNDIPKNKKDAVLKLLNPYIKKLGYE